MARRRTLSYACLTAATLLASIPIAAASIRAPLGVYAKIDVQDAINAYNGPSSQLHAYLQNLYANLLADSAIAGLTIGGHWNKLQPAATAYDWSELDDAFTAATAAHKSLQLNLTPGFDSPSWLLAQIPACDTLFTSGSAPANCGTMTFAGFPQEQRAVGDALPLPWNTVYQAAWATFLTSLNVRYGSNPAFVAIVVTGPVGASNEMIFPTSANTTAAQPSGLAVDATWAALIQHSFPSNAAYQNTDQAFIDAWKQAIQICESIFSGITLVLTPDSGNDFPSFSKTVTLHSDNTLFAQDCSAVDKAELMSCEAKTDILSYFVTVAGPNGKATQVGGMTASSSLTPGDIGVQGVKVLTALTPVATPALLGGTEFDFPVVGASLQAEGCADPSGTCLGLTPEEAAYHVMTVFFTGTPAAAFYGGTLGTAPVQYLAVPYTDVQYALSTPCPAAPGSNIGYMSLQDLYSRASHDLLAMANQPTALPVATCTSYAPAISQVVNAEGGAAVIAPNTWVEVAGVNLAPAGDVRPWQASDFVGGNLPASLDGVSVTVNGQTAYLYYISPTQINILTPPNSITGSVQVVVTVLGAVSAAYTLQAEPASPSFFVFGGGPYVIAQHAANYALVGPASLYPGMTTPAKPGETLVLYANGFGPTTAPVVAGSKDQSGSLSPLPTVKIGGISAPVSYAALVSPGLFQINVQVPANAPSGDNSLTATIKGVAPFPSNLLTIQNP